MDRETFMKIVRPNRLLRADRILRNQDRDGDLCFLVVGVVESTFGCFAPRLVREQCFLLDGIGAR